MRVGVHGCAHPACRKSIPVDLLACRPHWYALPRELRNQVWIAWQALCSGVDWAIERHDAAKAACLDWWAAH